MRHTSHPLQPEKMTETSHPLKPEKMTETSHPLKPKKMTQTSHPLKPEKMTQTSHPLKPEKMTETSHPLKPEKMTQTSHPLKHEKVTETSHPLKPEKMTQTSHPLKPEKMTQTSQPLILLVILYLMTSSGIWQNPVFVDAQTATTTTTTTTTTTKPTTLTKGDNIISKTTTTVSKLTTPNISTVTDLPSTSDYINKISSTSASAQSTNGKMPKSLTSTPTTTTTTATTTTTTRTTSEGSTTTINPNFRYLSEQIEKLRTSGYLFFPHIYRAFLDAGKAPGNFSISNMCGENLAKYYTGLNDRKGWAWNMYDSTGKQGAGLFTGALTWTGNFQQCLNTLGYYSQLTQFTFTSGGEVPAQYCSVYIATPRWVVELVNSFNLPFPVPLPSFIGDVCIVEGCSEADIQSLVQQYVDQVSWRENLTVTAVKCHKYKNVLNDVPAVVSICVIALLLLLVAMGTVYDIILRARRSGVKSSRDIPIGVEAKARGKFSFFKSTEQDGMQGPILTGYMYRNSACNTKDEEGLKTSHSDKDILEKNKDASDPDLAEKNEDLLNSAPSSSPSSPLKSPDDMKVVIEQCYGTFHKSYTPVSQNGESNEVHKLNNLNDASEETVKSTDSTTISEALTLSESLSSPSVTNDDCTLNNETTKNIPNHENSTPSSPNHLPEITIAKPGSIHRPSLYSSPDRSFRHDRSLKRSGSFPRMQKRHLKTQLSMIAFEKAVPSTVNLFQRLLVCFSIRRNLSNILGKGHADTMFCLNGIRVLSIGWIVLGSYYSALYSNPSIIDNHVDAVKMTQQFWIQPFINTTLAADTFFVLSGTLYAYNFMKLKSKSKGKKMYQVLSIWEYLLSVIHRLARILPCYYLVIMIYTNLNQYFTMGQDSRHGTQNNTACTDHWWANAIFISNFYKADKMCMPWTYYLVNDFQFSLLSPLVVIPLLCHTPIGFAIIGALIGVQILSVMLINTGINGNVMRMGNTKYFSQVYVKPYCRVAAYAVGLGLGYLLFTSERKVQLRKLPLTLGWMLCLIVVAVLPYITYLENQPGGKRWTGVETSLYEALSRPIWALAVAWLIFCCCNGQGGFISKFLSWNFFLPLCRVTYGVYLLHPIVIAAVIESSHSNVFLTFGEVTYGYVANFVTCWCLALIFIAVVEQPFVHIEAAVRRHLHAKRA